MALPALLLISCLSIGLFKIAHSQVPAAVKKVIAPTYCCKGGLVSGFRNDCVSGEGDCVDHDCLQGEIESVNDCARP